MKICNFIFLQIPNILRFLFLLQRKTLNKQNLICLHFQKINKFIIFNFEINLHFESYNSLGSLILGVSDIFSNSCSLEINNSESIKFVEISTNYQEANFSS